MFKEVGGRRTGFGLALQLSCAALENKEWGPTGRAAGWRTMCVVRGFILSRVNFSANLGWDMVGGSQWDHETFLGIDFLCQRSQGIIFVAGIHYVRG